jgi:membrane protein YdbS with pleckstrin-like domain
MANQEIFYEGRVHPDYKKKALLNTLIRLILTTLPISIIFFIEFIVLSIIPFGSSDYFFNYFAIIVPIIVIVMIIANAYYNRYIKNFSFVVTENDVIINHGVFRQVRASIPYCRVQNISINSTIFERRYNLSSINIETAGSSSSPYRGYRGYRRRFAQGEGFIMGQKDPTYLEKLLKEKINSCLSYMESAREGTVL